MTTVIKLTENQRVSFTGQQRFRDFLIRLRNGGNTFEEWALLCSPNVSRFNVSSINTTSVRLPYINSVVAENNFSMFLMLLNKSVYKIKALPCSSKAAKPMQLFQKTSTG